MLGPASETLQETGHSASATTGGQAAGRRSMGIWVAPDQCVRMECEPQNYYKRSANVGEQNHEQETIRLRLDSIP